MKKRITGDDELRDAAREWYRRALGMRRPGQGLAGLLSWVDAVPAEARGRAWDSGRRSPDFSPASPASASASSPP